METLSEDYKDKIQDLEIKVRKVKKEIEEKGAYIMQLEVEKKNLLEEIYKWKQRKVEKHVISERQVLQVMWETEGCEKNLDRSIESEEGHVMCSTQELGHEESVLQMSQPLSDIEKVSSER